MHALRTLHLFAGAGGGILTDLLLGHVPVGAVEIDPYCQQVLIQRQADGFLPWFPIFSDVQTFDGHPWRGLVDVVSGGFPCQDISLAGNGAGLSGARSGLWAEFARLIGEIRPRYAFIENVPALTVRGLDRVLSDLAALGMDVRWCCLGADNVGAPHLRKRLWILATNPQREFLREQSGGSSGKGGAGAPQSGDDGEAPDVAHTTSLRCDGHTAKPHSLGACENQGGLCQSPGSGQDMAHAQGVRMEEQPVSAEGELSVGDTQWSRADDSCHNRRDERRSWWTIEPNVGRVAYGVADKMDRLRALGNGWVPQCAALAWRILATEEHTP